MCIRMYICLYVCILPLFMCHITYICMHTPPRQKNWKVNTGKKNFNPTAMMYSWKMDEMRIGGRAAIFPYTELLKACRGRGPFEG